MESSFKKGYEKTINADGSFELKFPSKRFAPMTSGAAMLLGLFILFPASCAATFPVASMFVDIKNLAEGSLLTWNILAFIVYFLALHFFYNTKSKILVKPNSGVVFNGKQLPFKEIQSLGTIDHPNAQNKKGSAFVYADTHGTQVMLTKYISLSLAEAVEQEIKAAI